MKRLKYFFVSLLCLILLIGCGNNHSQVTSDTNEAEEGVDSEKIAETEEQQEENEKTYTTLADMEAVLTDYLSKTYSDGSVEIYSDPYDDSMIINHIGNVTAIEKWESDYQLIFYPYLGTTDNGGTPTFVLQLPISYGSFSFLDWLSDSDCIFLAADETRYSFPIYASNKDNKNSIYTTEMLINFDENMRDELDMLYDIIQKDGLSMRINQLNNSNEYVTVDLDEATKQSIKDAIELYYELYDVLYK